MGSGDKEPLSLPSISATWEGSNISIYNLDSILLDARKNTTSIYDRSDLPFPIERLQVSTSISTQSDEETLLLSSDFQLDKTNPPDPLWLKDRFNKYLAPQNSTSANYQKRPPFKIHKTAFDTSFLVTDEDTGAKFLLWNDIKSGKIVITNSLLLSRLDIPKKVSIKPPAIQTISPADQFKSLFMATALVADFINAFHINNTLGSQIKGIPLKREYIVGKERRPITAHTQAKKLGKIAVNYPVSQSEPETSEPESVDLEKELGIDFLKPDEAIMLSDIGGLDRVKIILRDIATSFNHPEIMEKWGATRPQGVLLYGDPGTGKTMLAQALANEIGADLMAIQSTDIYEKWLGNSENRIKEIFKKIRKIKKPTIVFFDEFETIVGITDEPSPGGADNARNAVAGIFKQEMNTLAKENPKILIVAATNSIEKINPSLIRSGRFDYKIYVPMPDPEARKEIVINIISRAMLGNEANGFRMFAEDLDIHMLAQQTDGRSGADITEIFRRISLSRAMAEARSGMEQPPISQTEIEREILYFRQNG